MKVAPKKSPRTRWVEKTAKKSFAKKIPKKSVVEKTPKKSEPKNTSQNSATPLKKSADSRFLSPSKAAAPAVVAQEVANHENIPDPAHVTNRGKFPKLRNRSPSLRSLYSRSKENAPASQQQDSTDILIENPLGAYLGTEAQSIQARYGSFDEASGGP
jgi:hypothetical protein